MVAELKEAPVGCRLQPESRFLVRIPFDLSGIEELGTYLTCVRRINSGVSTSWPLRVILRSNTH